MGVKGEGGRVGWERGAGIEGRGHTVQSDSYHKEGGVIRVGGASGGVHSLGGMGREGVRTDAHTHTHTHARTHTQTDRQTDRQTHTQTDMHGYKHGLRPSQTHTHKPVSLVWTDMHKGMYADTFPHTHTQTHTRQGYREAATTYGPA